MLTSPGRMVKRTRNLPTPFSSFAASWNDRVTLPQGDVEVLALDPGGHVSVVALGDPLDDAEVVEIDDDVDALLGVRPQVGRLQLDHVGDSTSGLIPCAPDLGSGGVDSDDGGDDRLLAVPRLPKEGAVHLHAGAPDVERGEDGLGEGTPLKEQATGNSLPRHGFSCAEALKIKANQNSS